MAVSARVLAPEESSTLPADAHLRALIAGFPSEEGCRAFLERVRWPQGVRCPRCDASRGISRIESRGQFECDACGYQFSVRAGTAFHASHLPLWKWLLAVRIVTASEDRVSADRLRRAIGVSYKTAWHVSRVIRSAPRGRGSFLDTVRALVGGQPAAVAATERGPAQLVAASSSPRPFANRR